MRIHPSGVPPLLATSETGVLSPVGGSPKQGGGLQSVSVL
uniref:Uncharacterized protein n=1 Tax=Anguilla anguilla TaxID=7936 RepID=A0A0E9WHW8_ANGAN